MRIVLQARGFDLTRDLREHRGSHFDPGALQFSTSGSERCLAARQSLMEFQ